jgi:hypothetical protein
MVYAVWPANCLCAILLDFINFSGGVSMKAWIAGLAAAGVLVGGAAQAALVDLGNGQIKATGSGFVWLQNANLAATNTFGVSGIFNEGRMTWTTANAWIAAMNAADYLGYNDWMLPTTLQPDPSCSNQAGGDSRGFNCTGSPMGELFYIEGGLSVAQPITASSALTSVFNNMQSDTYWSGTAYAPNPVNAWSFITFGGIQDYYAQSYTFHAWAVRPGDVAAAAPEPATLVLTFAGLGLAGLARRRRPFGAS